MLTLVTLTLIMSFNYSSQTSDLCKLLQLLLKMKIKNNTVLQSLFICLKLDTVDHSIFLKKLISGFLMFLLTIHSNPITKLLKGFLKDQCKVHCILLCTQIMFVFQLGTGKNNLMLTRTTCTPSAHTRPSPSYSLLSVTCRCLCVI